jgi:hypothetical protein
LGLGRWSGGSGEIVGEGGYGRSNAEANGHEGTDNSCKYGGEVIAGRDGHVKIPFSRSYFRVIPGMQKVLHGVCQFNEIDIFQYVG